MQSRTGEPGLDATQAGISNATGLTRGYVSRTMAPLLKHGLVLQRSRRAPGFARALVEYELAEGGKTEIAALARSLSVIPVEVRRGGMDPSLMPIGDVAQKAEPRLTLFRILSQLELNGCVDLEAAATPRKMGASFVQEIADAPAEVEFVGRTAELAEFSRWLEGNGSVYVVEGPGGIGKTTLVAHALHSQPVRRHVLWLRILGTVTGREVVERLDRFLTGLGRPASLPRNDDARALFEHLRPRVKGFPLLVVIDDVQKADPTLAQALKALADLAQAGLGLKLALIGRNVEVPETPLRDAVRRRLLPFSEAEAEQLLASRGSRSESRPSLVKAGAGNPLFLGLLARMPDAATRRIDFSHSLGRDLAATLSPQHWDILKWVSAMRTPASSEAFERLGLGSPAALTEIVSTSLLWRDDEGRYGMHDVVREALYDQVEFRERKRLHEGLAEFYRPSKEDWSGVAEYLHHLVRAGRGNEALRWVMRNRTMLMEQAHALFATAPPPAQG